MKTLDIATTDYIAIVGQIDVWRDSAYFYNEAAMDIMHEFGQSYTNEFYAAMKDDDGMVREHFSKKEKIRLSFHDLEILKEFFSFEFKPNPNGIPCPIDPDTFTQKSQYLIRITRK